MERTRAVVGMILNRLWMVCGVDEEGSFYGFEDEIGYAVIQR